jgi:zinc protease
MTKKTILIVAFAFAAAAQQPQPMGRQQQSLAGVVRLNRAPVSHDVIQVKLPRPVERQLSNGLKLIVVESHRVPQISLQIRMPGGDLRDPAGMPGVSDATAALIRLGTKTRSSKDIAEALAELSATVSFSSTQDGSTIFVNALTETFDPALDLLTDVLMNPTFPQDEFDKWKARQRAQLVQMKANPGALANDLLYKKLYGADARQYTHPSVESLDKMTRDDVVQFYKTYYVPSGELAGVAGDITPAEAVAKLNKALAAWKGGPVKRVELPLTAPVTEKKIYLIPRPNSVQTTLLISNHAIDRTNPDYIECQVMNRVLGGSANSRLFRIVREEKGYTYGIASGFSATRLLNHFGVNTNVRTEVTEPALAEILKQLSEIRDKPVPDNELADVKSSMVAGFVMGMETSAQVLARWMEQRVYGLPEDYWDTYSQKVMAVTPEGVMRVAKKYVPVDNAQIIAVGDSSKIAEALKKFGPVEETTVDK